MHLRILLCLLCSIGIGHVVMAVEGQPAMKTAVQREGTRVWLTGVTGWSTSDQESSVQAAEAAAMQALGYRMTYDDLLGISGLAFRFQVHKDGFCGSSPHSSCGFPCVVNAQQALPWQIRSADAKSDNTEKVKQIRQQIVDSIDHGVPVQYGSEEDGLIIGYQDSGNELLCLHPYVDGGKTMFVEKEWPWGFTFYTAPKVTPPDRRALQTASLQQAVTMATTTSEADGYHLGYAAWDHYLTRLKTLTTADAKTRADEAQGNAWIYECLVQYRRAAHDYLKAIANDYSPEAAQHLRQAADLYMRMANTVLTDDTHTTLAVAPYPWMLQPGDTWTPEQIQHEIGRLEKALPMEKQAIEEIRQALAVIGQ